MRTHTSSRLKNEKIIVALLVTICLVSAFSIAIPVTTAKKESKESKTGFRKSDNPILNPPIDVEKWQPIMPPEPSELSSDKDTEHYMNIEVYDVKTKKVRRIPKNFTKTEIATLKSPENRGSLPSELILESVIGYDDRERVTPTTDFHWRTICKLWMYFPSRGWFMGSGVIIDDYHILTAGHCVYDPDLGEYAYPIEVIPAYDDGYTPFYHALVTEVWLQEGWSQYGDRNYDWAVCTLDRNIGSLLGWMGRKTGPWGDPMYTGMLNTAGYPGDLDDGMYWDADYGHMATTYIHWYHMDTAGGQSGSPVWQYFSVPNEHYILSVHTRGVDYTGCNSGTRLNENKFDLINYILSEDVPPTDYANLIDDGQDWSGFSPTPVVPGVTPFSVWSDIINIGTVESGEFQISYYASTDTEITASDHLIGTVPITSIQPFYYRDSDWSGTFPSDIPDGTYWVGWIIDSTNVVPEPLDYGEDNNIAYKDSYQLTVESVESPALITYYTNPNYDVSITFDYDDYTDGESGSYLPNDYLITANEPTGYQFLFWDYDHIGEPGVGVYVPNIGARTTMATVSGNGWLKAAFKAAITFRTEPSGIGSITYGGTDYTDGQTLWEVGLPPDNSNAVPITANPSDSYTFSHWDPIGQIWVASTTSITTDLTVNGPGVLTAIFEGVPEVLEIDYVMTTDYVERDWGEYDDTMIVLGSGSKAGATINLYWDFVTASGLLNTTVANPDGIFEVRFDVPEAVAGAHYIWVRDMNTDHTAMWGPLTVVPTITLDVENGPVGTVVTVSGSGFTKNGMVDTITINGTSCTIIPTTLLVNPVGTITGAFVIPSVENLGVYEITVTDSSGLAANNDFLITGLAELVVSPTYGAPGSIITVTGSNFTQIAGTEVDIDLYETDGITFVCNLVTAETDAYGTFEDTFVSPAIDFNTYVVIAEDEYSIDANDSFKIGLIALIINPSYGEAGTKLSITGIGFAPGVYNVTFGDKLYEDYGTVTSGEAISDLFYVPNVEPGIYDLTVIDTDENELIVQFTVTESTYVIADPALAPNDYNVSIKGYHFADIVGAVDFVIYNSTDEWLMDVWQNGAGTDPAETNVDGNFIGWWIVPVKDTLSLGDYTINITGSKGLLVQIPFSVVEARVDVAPRKAQFVRGDIVAFDIVCDFKYPEAYIEIYDPSDILYWQTDVLDTWLKVEGLYVVPYYAQTSGLEPMELALDAPLGTWLYRFYEDADTELMNGTFIVTPPIPPLPPELSNLVITPDVVELGDSVTISVDIENIDNQSFTYIVTMQIGELTLLVDVDLEPYEFKTVSQTITPDAVGEYNVIIGGLTGSFTVVTNITVSIGSATIASSHTTEIPVNMSQVTKIAGLGFDLYWNPDVVNITSIRLSDDLPPSTSLSLGIDPALGKATVALVNTNPPDHLTWEEEKPVLIVEIEAIGLHGTSSILDLEEVEVSDAEWNPIPVSNVEDGIVTIQNLGSIHGYVTYSYNGAPMEGATVELLRYGSTLNTTVTSVNGEYEFLDILLREYNLTASHERIQNDLQYTTFWNASASVNVIPGEITEVYFSLMIRGDLNDIGRVDIGDVAKIANMYVGNIPVDMDFTDFNGNGWLDIGDIAKLANYYVGNLDEV